MPIPSALQYLCEGLASDLTQASFLHPTPHQRRAIYIAFGAWDQPSAQRARAWLALFAAQRALPVFQSRFPDEDLPALLIETALGVLTGTAQKQTTDEVAEWGYNAAGHCWGYDEDEFPLYVDYAGQAAYHALGSTTHGLYFLQNLDTDFGTMRAQGVHIISGPEWTNQRLLDFPTAPDVALYAAAALTTDPATERWEQEAWQTFWMWWLNEAIPMAWAYSFS